MGRVLAAVDIGSNTVHLLVAEVTGKSVSRLTNESNWLSLGEVVGREGVVPPHAADKLITSLAEFQVIARQAGAEKLIVFATEAMRVAKNSDAILRQIEKRTGIRVDLITPRREAELGAKGALLDCDGEFPAVLVEVGGGSAQVARLENGKVAAEVGLPIGTGKLIAQTGLVFPASDSAVDALRGAVREALSRTEDIGSVKRVITCGGVARGLWRAVHPDGDRMLHQTELEYLAWATQRLPIDKIAERFLVKFRRAGTLLPGAVVYGEVLRRFGFDSMVVSQFGVREGAILEMAERSKEK